MIHNQIENPLRYRVPRQTRAGYEWCYSHRRSEPKDDLIDFEVADCWRDHYFDLGLTPWLSSKHPRLLSSEVSDD